MTVSTADLWDERGSELQSCSVQLRHYGGRSAFSGPISTVRCHRDNALVKAALAEPGQGRVLVVDGGGSLESALMGDLIAASAVEQGWAGVVIHGAVRDVVALRELPLGALALGSNPRKSAKDGVGERDVPVAFGGVEFVPGPDALGRRGRRGRHPSLTGERCRECGGGCLGSHLRTHGCSGGSWSSSRVRMRRSAARSRSESCEK